MLKHRLITAAILIPLVILAIFKLSVTVFAVILALILSLAAWEWAKLAGITSLGLQITYIIFLFILFFLSAMVPTLIILSLGVIYWLTIPIFYVFNYSRFAAFWSKDIFWRLLQGIFIFVPTWAGLIYVKALTGPAFVLTVLVWIWAADTGAYFVGKFFGKHKLAPAISPGKSIEGFIGGTATTLLFAIISIFLLNEYHRRALYLVVLALVVALTSVLGDLFESMVKRQARVKDSGHWLPGHGGIYDRIDSLTAAIPFFALGLALMNNF